MYLLVFTISDDVSLSEAHSSPLLVSRGSKSATPSPVALSSRRGTSSSQEWNSNEEDIDRLVALHNRSSLSSLGVCRIFLCLMISTILKKQVLIL